MSSTSPNTMARRTFLKLSVPLSSAALSLRSSHAYGLVSDSPPLFPVCVSGRWGYINAVGRLIIPPRFERTNGFSQDMAPAGKKQLWGFIDTDGRWIIEPRYKYAFGFGNAGLAQVELEDGEPAFIDRTGSVILRFSGGERPEGFTEGLCCVKSPSLPRNGVQFQSGEAAESRDLQQIWLSKVWFIDVRGKRAFPEEFDYAWSFSQGLCAVKVDNKYGFIDQTGKMVLPPQYDSAHYFQEGVACVQRNDRYIYIDRKGEAALTQEWEEASFFSEGLATIRIGKKWGYINKRGDIVIPPTFENADPFHEGHATCRLNGKYGVIDTSGKWIVSPGHAYIGWFGNGLACYSNNPIDPDGSQRGYLDRNGTIVWLAPPYTPPTGSIAPAKDH